MLSQTLDPLDPPGPLEALFPPHETTQTKTCSQRQKRRSNLYDRLRSTRYYNPPSKGYASQINAQTLNEMSWLCNQRTGDLA